MSKKGHVHRQHDLTEDDEGFQPWREGLEPYGHPRFYELLREMAELHNRKNRQYASSENPLGNFYRGSQICKALFKEQIAADPEKLALAYAIVLATKQIDGTIEILGHGKNLTPDSLKEKMSDVTVYFNIGQILAELITDIGNSEFDTGGTIGKSV